MKMTHSTRALGWCQTHRKLLYLNRKAAKKAAREHRDHKNVYVCSENQDLFHVGAVPEEVIRGELTRGEYFRNYYGDAS